MAPSPASRLRSPTRTSAATAVTPPPAAATAAAPTTQAVRRDRRQPRGSTHRRPDQHPHRVTSPAAVLSWEPDRAAVGHEGIRQVLAGVMNMRLPLRCRTGNVLLAGNLALITGERSMRGTGPD